MTCIVGIAHEGRVFIGADSAGISGLDRSMRADRKVFRKGDFVMGFTSSFRMGQLLAVKFQPPPHWPDKDVWHYMVDDFTDAVRKLLGEGGFKKTDHGVETGGTFLVGYRGRIFQMENDFQVGERMDGFDACGCGESYALGSLLETKASPPRERIERALVAAATFSAGVAPPFFIEEGP